MAGYEDDWREYKRIRNIFLIVFVLYVPVCFSIGALSVQLFDTITPGFVVAFLYGCFCRQRDTHQSLAVSELRRLVLRNMVVQPGFSSQALCALRAAEVQQHSSPRCCGSFHFLARRFSRDSLGEFQALQLNALGRDLSQIVVSLLSKPGSRAAAKYLREAHRHFWGYSALFVDQF
jgi:hypothetical protein